MNFWLSVLIIAIFGGILWAVERRLARKDAEEQARLRAHAHAAAARAKAQLKSDVATRPRTTRRRES